MSTRGAPVLSDLPADVQARVRARAITAGPGALISIATKPKRGQGSTSDAEHQEQRRLFEWASEHEGQHPALCLMFAVPNFAGFHGTKKARMRSGARARDEGRKSGVPDIVLPVPRGGYGALYVELKAPGGSASKVQRTWIEALREFGNAAHVCIGADDAKTVILAYLALPRPPRPSP